MPRYRVIGPQSYLGHPPKAIFTAELAPEQESRAIQRGAIRRLEDKQPSKSKTQD